MIITSTEYKTLYAVTGSSDNSRIELLIPIVNDFILTYCGLEQDDAELLVGLKLPAAQMIKYQLSNPDKITSETIGGYSYSVSETYPAFILNGLRPYRKVKYY